MLIKNSLPTLGRYAFVAVAGFMLTAPTIAQDIFEEIIVTAQKREQNIMVVPVAVTAVTGAQIEAAGIKDMFDLQQNVPGLIVGQSQTATTSNFAIRGIGSTSNNFGIESSVGLYVDQVYRSRQSSMINDLVDVEVVEVLRGPQGTLFGKNTPAGAIQILTVRPSTDGVDGFIEATAGDFGLGKLSGALNIPLSDTVAFRGTVFTSQRDGYVDDDTFGNDFHNDRDRTGVRLQLSFEPNDSLDARLIVDYSEIDEVCCVGISRVDGLYSRASAVNPATAIPGPDVAIASVGGSVFTNYPYPQPLLDALASLPGQIITGVGFDDFRVAYNDAPVSTNEDQGVSLDINKTFDNGLILTSISAFRAFETFDLIDGDFTGADIFIRTNDAEQDSFSQEFRLSGEFGNGGHYVTGVYYFEQEINSLSATPAGAAFNAYAQGTQPALAALVAGVGQVLAALPPGTLPPQTQPYDANTFALNDFKQDQDGWAVFGQVDIPLSDTFELTLGARYTDETKKINGVFADSSNGPPPDLTAIQAALVAASQGDFSQLPALLPVLAPNVSWGNYLLTELSPRPNVIDQLSDDQTTGTVKLTWLPSDTTMFYASYSTGFKAGGTNTDRIDPSFSTIFGPEESKSFEIGFKGDLGPVRVAAALFSTDFDDFQANSFTGTGFNLQNAGSVETNGLEVEAVWHPTDNLELQAFYAYNEGEFASFVGGTCWDTAVFHTLMPDPGAPFPGANQCDRTGGPIPYNPENRAFVAATQNFAVGNNNLWFRAEASYASEQFTDGDLDPFTLQDGYTIINLRIGLDIDSWNSTITAWGRNITDERYFHGSFDAPIQFFRMNSYPGEPSTFGVTFRKNFE